MVLRVMTVRNTNYTKYIVDDDPGVLWRVTRDMVVLVTTPAKCGIYSVKWSRHALAWVSFLLESWLCYVHVSPNYIIIHYQHRNDFRVFQEHISFEFGAFWIFADQKGRRIYIILIVLELESFLTNVPRAKIQNSWDNDTCVTGKSMFIESCTVNIQQDKPSRKLIC